MRIVILALLIGTLKSEAVAQQLYGCENGTASFRSDSPLEIIHAESKELKGLLDPAKRTFAFAVSIRSFEGFNAPLQREHFNENYLESPKFPSATFKGKIIEDTDFTTDTTLQVRTKGILTIHGIDDERIIKVTLSRKQNIFTIDAQFSVLLKDYNIRIPKVVHEKIASEVVVQIHVDLLPVESSK